MQVASHDPTLPLMRETLASNVALCQKLLDEAVASNPPRSVTNGERLRDMAALLAAGAWFYGVWGMGQAGASAAGALGPLLPGEYVGVERALALVLLLAMLVRVVVVRV